MLATRGQKNISKNIDKFKATTYLTCQPAGGFVHIQQTSSMLNIRVILNNFQCCTSHTFFIVYVVFFILLNEWHTENDYSSITQIKNNHGFHGTADSMDYN